jgi:hypothetical protein
MKREKKIETQKKDVIVQAYQSGFKAGAIWAMHQIDFNHRTADQEFEDQLSEMLWEMDSPKRRK